MNKKMLLGATLAMVAAGLLLAQRGPAPARALLADDGAVIAAHRAIHLKQGDTVTWGRQTAGQQTWHVQFVESPCQEGAEFGHDRRTTCTISVACYKAGDAACKTYHYRSALSAGAPDHDPDIVVDPAGAN